jgi:hypothetical protein
MTDPLAWRQPTTGPCTGCGNPTTRYGPRGRPHCDDCLPIGEWLAMHGLKELPPEECNTNPAERETGDRAPVRLAVIIQAFREHPEEFAAATLPQPPEAA